MASMLIADVLDDPRKLALANRRSKKPATPTHRAGDPGIGSVRGPGFHQADKVTQRGIGPKAHEHVHMVG